MAKSGSKATREAEIIPPQSDDAAPQGAGLRMPPIIDLAPSGLARLARITETLQRWLRSTAYQIVLFALLIMAVGLLGLAIMEAGNIEGPDWRALRAQMSGWSAQEEERLVPPADRTVIQAPASPIEPPVTSEGPSRTASETAAAPVAPDTIKSETASRSPLAVSEAMADSEAMAASQAMAAGQAMAAADALADLRATLAETRRDLAAAKQALLDSQAQPGDAQDLTRLRQKAQFGELLLRLDYGLPFDDLLDSGGLDTVLVARELAVLALYAETGLPTQATLTAQSDTLAFIIAAEAEPRAAVPTGLNWLAEAAPGLLQIRQTPMAWAGPDMQAIAAAMQAKDYRAAAANTRALALRVVADGGNDKMAAALQTLYADLRTYEETRAVLPAMRADYFAGVRP